MQEGGLNKNLYRKFYLRFAVSKTLASLKIIMRKAELSTVLDKKLKLLFLLVDIHTCKFCDLPHVDASSLRSAAIFIVTTNVCTPT